MSDTEKLSTPPVDLRPDICTYLWRLADREITFSAAATSIYGENAVPRTEPDLMGCIHPDDRSRFEIETSAIIESQTHYDREFRIQRPATGVAVIHDRGTVLCDDQGQAVALQGLQMEVTRHRQQVTGAQRTVSADGAATYEYHIARRVSSWSEAMFRLFDLEPTEHIKPHVIVRQKMHEDDRALVAEMTELASRRIGPFAREYRIVEPDGRVRWIFDQGETFGAIDPETGLAAKVRGTLTDITEIKAREATISVSNKTLMGLIDRSPFGIYVVDETLCIVQANAGAKQAFASVRPLIGTPLRKALSTIWSDDFTEEALARFRHTLTSGEPYDAPPLVKQRRDIDEIQAYDWQLQRIVRADGSYGVVCNFYDLTEREAEETRLRDIKNRLELAYETSAMGAWDLDLINGTAIWSDQLYQLIGVDPSVPATTEAFFECVHPDDIQTTRTLFARAIEANETFDTEYRVFGPDGKIRFLAARGRVVEWKNGVASRMIGVNYDTTRRRRVERELRESGRRLRVILDNAIAFIGVLDPDGTLREANETALRAAGVTRDDVIDRPFWEAHWWTGDPAIADRLKEAIIAARAGQIQRYDTMVRVAGDDRITIDFMLAPIFDDAGQVYELVASGFDISDREAASARVRTLMNEINHRSKNLLSLVSVIARQTAKGDPANYIERFQSRLRALAAAQDLLVRDDWDGVYLNDLITSQLAHFAGGVGSRVRLRGPAVQIGSEAAQSIGMALHELATNAAKYGALSVETGSVQVAWGATEAQDTLELTWTELGGPKVEPPQTAGFGSFVTDTMLGASLSAEVTVDYRPEGLHWRAIIGSGIAFHDEGTP